MRMLLINPNTSASITNLLVENARHIAAPSTIVAGTTAQFGARYIASRAAAAIAEHAAIDCYARDGATADVVVLACFGDPGLSALREVAHQPVIGMAEASCLMAAQSGQRFSIVTGGTRWRPMLEEFVNSMGLSKQLASVETVALSGADIARDPETATQHLLGACTTCLTDHGADVIILGGAGLAGLAGRLQPRIRVPLIDGLFAAVKAGEAQSARPPSGAKAGPLQSNLPSETFGLSPALTALFNKL